MLLRDWVFLSNLAVVLLLVVYGVILIGKKKHRDYLFGIFFLILFFVIRGLDGYYGVFDFTYFFISPFQILWFVGIFFVIRGGIKRK